MVVKSEPGPLHSIKDKGVVVTILSQPVVADDGMQLVRLLLALDVRVLELLLKVPDALLESADLCCGKVFVALHDSECSEGLACLRS